MAHPWQPLAPSVNGLVRPVPVDPTGRHGPTPGRARGSAWRRTSPGLFVPGDVVACTEQRILEAAARSRSTAVVTAWPALRLHGANFFDGLARDGHTPLPVVLAANGERILNGPGVLVVRDTVPDDERVFLHGMAVAGVERALFDEMRRLRDPWEAAVAASMAFAAGLTDTARMRRYCAERRWFRDVRTLLGALDLAVEGARSPQEVRFGFIWEHDAGWGRPLFNRSVLDLDGRFVAMPDLLDPARGVVGEYAGADHRDIDRHESDIAREAALRAVGLEYVEVVGRDLRHRDRVVRRMLEAESRVSPGPRRWRLAPPRP